MRKQLTGIRKAFGIVWDADKKYPCLLLLRALAASAAPLYFSVCVSRLISGLAGEGQIDSIILIFFCCCPEFCCSGHWMRGLRGSAPTGTCACRMFLP